MRQNFERFSSRVPKIFQNWNWKLFKSNKILSVIFIVLKQNINAWILRVVDHRLVCVVGITWLLIRRYNHPGVPLGVFTDQNFGVIHVAKSLAVWWWVGRMAGIRSVTGEINSSAVSCGWKRKNKNKRSCLISIFLYYFNFLFCCSQLVYLL
jgi:hypothetical protein